MGLQITPVDKIFYDEHLGYLRDRIIMSPRQTVTPVVFGPATQEYDLDASNRYVSQVAHLAPPQLPGLMVSRPEWTAQ